jgi:hypothetical protein
LLSVVIAGLDPAIHAATPRTLQVSMDRLVKRGGDAKCAVTPSV